MILYFKMISVFVLVMANLLVFSGCSGGTNDELDNAKAKLELAEAEVAKLKAEAEAAKAKTEAEQAKAELARLKSNTKTESKDSASQPKRTTVPKPTTGQNTAPLIPLTRDAMLKKYPFGGVVYTFSQSTGEFKIGEQVLCRGSSGEGTARNNPAMQQQANGPIPRGRYTLGKIPAAKTFSRKADLMTLMPAANVETFGRRPGLFLVVPDGPHQGDGYKAAIVVPRNIWDLIIFHGGSVVDVVQ